MPYQLENTMPTLVTTDSDAEYMEYQLSTEFCKGEMVGDSDITRYTILEASEVPGCTWKNWQSRFQ